MKHSKFVNVDTNSSSYKRILFIPDSEDFRDKTINPVYQFHFVDDLKEMLRSQPVYCQSAT